MPLFHAKIGRWQTASIPGRGINDARKAIRKWVRERDSRVFVKLDVVKCYPSIDRAVLKTMLAHDVGDRRLLRLVFTLVDQYRGDRGLNIGSYLSQWLANYYLSAAWHYAEGSLSAVRRSRRRQGEEIRRRLVTHVLFYADDILLIGRSKRDLTIAVKRLRGFLRDRLHLEIHSTWNVKHIGAEPIDMVGYTFRPGRTGVRPAIFLRAERAYARAAKRPMTMAMARILRMALPLRQRGVPPPPRHRQDFPPGETRGLRRQNRKDNTMIQKVSSSEQLQELDYHARGDGTADIRIRKNIKQVTHETTDQAPAWSEWTAIESYQVLPLQEQEAIEQADMLFEGDVTSSQPVLDRITALEQSSLDNAQLLADLLADDSTDDSANHTPSDTDATEDKTTTGGADADTAEPGKEE